MKMSKNEFIEYLKSEVPHLIFEPISKIDEVFNPFIEDDTIEEFDYDIDVDNSVKIIFTFKDDSTFIVNIEAGDK